MRDSFTSSLHARGYRQLGLPPLLHSLGEGKHIAFHLEKR